MRCAAAIIAVRDNQHSQAGCNQRYFITQLIEAVRTHSAVCWIIITDEIERERYLFSFYDIRMHSALCAMTI